MKSIVIAFALCVTTWTLFSDGLPFEDESYIYRAYYDDLFSAGFRFSFNHGYLTHAIPSMASDEEANPIKQVLTEPYATETKGQFVLLNTPTTKFVVLSENPDICILADRTTGDSFWGVSDSSDYVKLRARNRYRVYVGLLGAMNDYQKVSSALEEDIKGRHVKYDGLQGRYYLDLNSPWIEGVKGYGVGEWISKNLGFETDRVVIVNGFVDPKRLYLFDENSRVKKLRISSRQGDCIFSLKDQAAPQILSVPWKILGDVRFTILEVYAGSKYEDTAISGIYFLTRYGE